MNKSRVFRKVSKWGWSGGGCLVCLLHTCISSEFLKSGGGGGYV